MIIFSMANRTHTRALPGWQTQKARAAAAHRLLIDQGGGGGRAALVGGVGWMDRE